MAADRGRGTFVLLAVAAALCGARAAAADGAAGAGTASAGVQTALGSAPAEPVEAPPLARPGPYLGGGAFAALSDFDSSLEVDDTWGGRWWLGYRFHPHLAGELRGDVLSHFDLNGFGLSADLKGWSAEVFGKVYALTGRLQPYFALGAGAFVGDLELERQSTGASSHDEDAVSLLHVGLGLDVVLTEHLYLNLEGTYAVLGDDLDGANFGALGLGMGWRF
jgi:opacity protein-like surface antigen